MLKAVLFDMDGVLIDSEWIYWTVEKQMAQKLNVPFTESFKQAYCGIPPDVMWNNIVNTYGLNIPAQDLVREEKRMLLDFYRGAQITPIEPAVALVHLFAAKGVKCAIATSNTDEVAGIVVEKLGIKKDISFISTADHVQNAKPSPDIFLLAAKALCAEPKDCLVIEDSASGVKAARAAGMAVIGYISPNSGKQDLSLANAVTDDIKSITYGFCVDLVNKHKESMQIIGTN